ncbi:MAG TPA: ABC transporter ATP-binding protein [Cytophagales bacterium]|nr:ABC transporter ATP-binding protein [Cytophagales bacterium]
MIEITGVTKSFKSLIAVNDLSLEIRKGEYVALLGPNGAGKTTLVEMIEGLQFPDKGQIIIDGKSWKKHSSFLRRKIGISLQETKFMDKVTVEETIDLFASFYKLPSTRIQEILDLVNLNEKRKSFVSKLSGGQRQRLALGIALINNPAILILDEPTTGLDPNARREIWKILQKLKKEHGTTLLLTTHYMEEAEELCDRIIIMFEGKIMAEGTLESLLKLYSKGEIIEFKTEKPIEVPVEQLKGVINIKQNSSQTEVSMEVENITEVLPSLINLLKMREIPLLDLECRRKTLDDLFVAMTGRRLNE